MIPLVIAAAVVAAKAAPTFSLLQFSYTIAGILAGVAVICAGVTKFIWPVIRWFRNFAKDWDGEPARPGVEAKPGMMLRMSTLEFDLKAVKHEVHLNSGQSIKDIVQRSEGKIDDLHARVDAIDTQREHERVDRND